MYFNILTPYNATKLLESAEKQDNYIEEINGSHSNTYARNGSIYTPKRLNEREYFTHRMVLLQKIREIPLLPPCKKPINIIIMDDTADHGLPHTRPNNIICIPYKILLGSDEDLKEIIFHEMVHIWQRENPIETDALYTTGWKCTRSSADVVEGERINPDAMDLWVWSSVDYPDELYIVRPRFTRQDAAGAKLNDIRMTFYNITKIESSIIVPETLYNMYGSYSKTSAMEHPNEMMAYMWVNLMYKSKQDGCKAEKILSEWLRKYVYN